MARPTKQGVDYFPLDVHMDDKIKFVEIKYKLEGFAIVIKLMQRIYSQGYWCKWTEDELLLFSDEIKADIELVKNVVNECLERGFFNKKLYDDYNILTSNGIQKRYKEIVRRRKDVSMIEEYLLIDGNWGVNDDINPTSSGHDDSKSTQSKVNKTKEDNKDIIPFSEIVSFLNQKTGKNFKPTTNKTQTSIEARWNEGFVVDDFKKVINAKANDWKHDEKMSKYLRPETLFGTKFEGYLNESVSSEDVKETDPDIALLEKKRELEMSIELGEEYWRKFESIEEYENIKRELRELEQQL